MTAVAHGEPVIRREPELAVVPGRPMPFGATAVPGGVNFAVYSTAATAMTLVLYRRGEDEPLAELPFPESGRIGGVYAMTVLGIDAGDIAYAYRADGPYDPVRGHRFDASKLLVDPYATALVGRDRWRAPGPVHRWLSAIADRDFDWDGDRPLRLPMEDLVVYEAHVRGLTAHPSSGVHAPGTFAGLIERIPYLAELGVTCLELLPMFEFDELDNVNRDPATGEALVNYWGYSTVGYFAPKAGYAATARTAAAEFKELVKQLHRAGIEVMLDVVFNHTAEGDERGPTLSLRGLDNQVYYLLDEDGGYANYSGAGNTVNCNHPVVRGFVLDCLRYWVTEFHVDGFRFDAATILGRSADGSPLANPPLLEALAHDPVLRDVKLVAEVWDAGGLSQIGTFPAYCRWSEWNAAYRESVRHFLRGDAGSVNELATRFVGSPDLYSCRGSVASVNFVTAHDGFTLRDLYTYERKRNQANGEDNLDGAAHEVSWNCGHEGETDDPEVTALRDRMVRNALLILLTSQGIPMLLAGDEAGRTQAGNNNAYCHDSPLTWLDWDLVDRNADLVRFTRRLIAFRKAHPSLRRHCHPTGASAGLFPEVSWHGVRAWRPDWSPHNRVFAAMLCGPEVEDGRPDCVYVAANAHWEPHALEPPALPDHLGWHVFADTASADAAPVGAEPPLPDQRAVPLAPRSAVVLVARPREESIRS